MDGARSAREKSDISISTKLHRNKTATLLDHLVGAGE